MAEVKTTYIVDLEVDTDKFKQQAKELESLNLFKLDLPKKEQLQDLLAEQLQVSEEAETIRKALRELEDFKGPEFDEMRKALEDKLEELTGEKQAKKIEEIKESITGFLKNIGNKILSSIKQFASEILDQAKELATEIASYSEHSVEFSQEATNLRLTYGLTGAEAYALQKAAEKSGFGNFEGYLENIAFATKETLDDFDETYKLALATYERDEEIAIAYQHFLDDFDDFKTELSMSLIDFFMNNKDVIMDLMQWTVELLDDILSLVRFLTGKKSSHNEPARTEAQRQSALSDIYNNYNSSNTTTNIKIDNSFTGVSPSEKKTFIDAGEMTYRQIIQAFK